MDTCGCAIPDGLRLVACAPEVLRNGTYRAVRDHRLVPIVDPRPAIEAEFAARSRSLADRRQAATTADERKTIEAELRAAKKERRRKLRAAQLTRW
jgi:hypothetical protein